MTKRTQTLLTAIPVGLILVTTTTAQAQYSDLQRLLFRGLEYGGTYSYLLQPQTGPLYNFNQFEQAVQFNRLAQGYTYESYRFVGPDSFGNANTLDLGPLKVQLGVDPTVTNSSQPIGVHSSIGYTTTLLPAVFFNMETGQRSYNQFSGISTFAPTPLHYTVTLNTGVEDLEWSGNALIRSSGNLNALGFYDLSLRFTNVGNYTADGLLVKDEQVTDFDLGPINVSGNLFLDATSSFQQSLGLPSQADFTRILSGASDKQKQVDDLLAKTRAGGTLTDAEWQFLLQQMIQTAYRTDPLGVVLNGLPQEVRGFEGLSFDMVASEVDTGASAADSSLVPEPGTLALCAAAFASSAVMRRWRRRQS
jgi:hypothetical protein